MLICLPNAPAAGRSAAVGVLLDSAAFPGSAVAGGIDDLSVRGAVAVEAACQRCGEAAAAIGVVIGEGQAHAAGLRIDRQWRYIAVGAFEIQIALSVECCCPGIMTRTSSITPIVD